MAHQRATLETTWFTRTSNQLLWRPPEGERIQVDAALLPTGVTTRLISNVLLRATGDGSLADPQIARMDLTDSQSGGFGGGTGNNLSSAFDTGGRIGITYKTHSWVLDDAYVGNDQAEPYLWEILGLSAGTPGGVLAAFITAVNDGENAVAAELIVWDGQGTDPFADAPDTVIGGLGSAPVTKMWLGATELEKHWLGSAEL